jgi:hypothetical protein
MPLDFSAFRTMGQNQLSFINYPVSEIDWPCPHHLTSVALDSNRLLLTPNFFFVRIKPLSITILLFNPNDNLVLFS